MSRKKPKNSGRPPAVKYDRFVKLWRTSESVADVAKALGIARTTCSAIAGRLRNDGVELKKFPKRRAQVIDAKALNRIGKR